MIEALCGSCLLVAFNTLVRQPCCLCFVYSLQRKTIHCQCESLVPVILIGILILKWMHFARNLQCHSFLRYGVWAQLEGEGTWSDSCTLCNCSVNSLSHGDELFVHVRVRRRKKKIDLRRATLVWRSSWLSSVEHSRKIVPARKMSVSRRKKVWIGCCLSIIAQMFIHDVFDTSITAVYLAPRWH